LAQGELLSQDGGYWDEEEWSEERGEPHGKEVGKERSHEEAQVDCPLDGSPKQPDIQQPEVARRICDTLQYHKTSGLGVSCEWRVGMMP
jgi:hypothetical protein